jgi:RimJ/RimL family protein N-acetyltransferase
MASPLLYRYEVVLRMNNTNAKRAGPTIHGERVFLRPMGINDAEHVVGWRNDPETLANIFTSEPITVESQLKWLNSPRKNRLDYVICLKDSKKPIGTVNFTNVDMGNLKAEAGKLLGEKSARGKGLAKEAFIVWISFGFRELGFNRIYIRTMVSNTVNIQLNKKLGFIEEGVLREDYRAEDGFADVLIMSILKSDAMKLGIYEL